MNNQRARDARQLRFIERTGMCQASLTLQPGKRFLMTRSILLAAIVSVSALGAASGQQTTEIDPYTPYPFAQITDEI